MSTGYLPLSSEYVSGLSVLSQLGLKHNSLKFVPADQVFLTNTDRLEISLPWMLQGLNDLPYGVGKYMPGKCPAKLQRL